MVTWETNELLHEVSGDVVALGRETGWCWLGLIDFYEDLKKMGVALVLNA
jgi:hypothetical protein